MFKPLTILNRFRQSSAAIKKYAVYLSFLLSPFFTWAQPTSSAHAIDSVTNLLRKDREDTLKVNHLVVLSREYRLTGDMDNARSFANQAAQLAEKLANKVCMAKAYSAVASVYYNMGIFPDALSCYFKALKVSEGQNNKEDIAAIYIGIGNIYKDEGNSTEALKDYFKALQVNTEINNTRGMSTAYVNMGIIYWDIKDNKQALNYYLKAFEIDRNLGSKNSMATDLTNMANVYNQQNDTAKAMETYRKSLDLFVSAGDRSGIAVATGNIGELYYKRKNFKEAEKYLMASAGMAQSIGDLKDVKYDYFVLSELYAEMKNWEKAYQCHFTYTNLQDSLTKLDDTKKMVSEQMTFDFERKEALQKAEQDKKDAIAKEDRSRQRILLLLITSLAILAALVALFIFRVLKATQREKLIAEQQRSLMELKALRAQMNPHFIFNAINSIQHFILKNDPDKAQKHLNKFSKLIRMVLENSKQESIPLSEEIQMLQLYTELEAVRFSSKFNYKFVVNPTLNPESVMVPPLLIQPFIENAIWHGLMHLKERDGELTVTFDKDNDTLKCVVEDNGIGRKRSEEMREVAQHHQPMGLSITHERVEVLNQVYKTTISVNVTDKTNADGTATGTRVDISIPLHFNRSINA